MSHLIKIRRIQRSAQRNPWVPLENTILETSHRHSVFTIPEELRVEIYWNRDLLKDMCDGIYQVINHWFEKMSKKRKYLPVVITVVHTFGRTLDFNPDIHAD